MARSIGLTGRIGSGKTAVSRMLEKLGCYHIDADLVARALMEPGQPAWKAVVSEFGPNIVTADQHINRAALGGLVFADPEALRRLDLAVHPHVTVELERQLQAMEATTIAVVEAIKLVEAGLSSRLDALWVVVTPDDVACDRLVNGRGMTSDDAVRRLRAQAPVDDKLRLADEIIDNGGDVAATERQVVGAFDRFLKSVDSKVAPLHQHQ